MPNAMVMIGIGVGFLLIYIILVLIDRKICLKRERRYCSLFVHFYGKTNDIKKTLVALQNEYSEKTKLSKALAEAIDHLDHSILRDYKTALGIVGKTFNSVAVNEMHKKYIEESKKHLNQRRRKN